MSSIYEVFNEPYMRLWSLSRKEKIVTFPDKNLNLNGRTLPSVIRQDEMIKIPSLTKSYDMLCFLLACYLWLEDYDYQLSFIINHFLTVARKFQYQNCWKIWFDLAEYFDLEVIEGSQQLYNEQRCRSSSGPNDQNRKLTIPERSKIEPFNREATIFSYQNFIEFLLLNFSEDDLFGNLYRRAKSLARNIKIVNSLKYQKYLNQRKVQRTIRHRGYRDKGTLPDLNLKARREANRLPEKAPEPQFDSLNQVIDWGSSG